MDAFDTELLRRSPLASATLEMCDFVFDDALLDSIFQQHRGRCYQDVLNFPRLVGLIRDALLRHDGSGHRLFLELERDHAEPVNESNFYRKLARTPVAVSRALLREGTARLGALMPADVRTLPACFDGFTVIAGDGKKIKNAAKRLKPTRGFSGKLLGAKALVALDLRRGLALAMSDSLDGETNDVPLVPELMAQLRGQVAGPMLTLWDRQFGDAATLRELSVRDGDAYLVRLRRGLNFRVETQVQSFDGEGHRVIDEIGWLGSGPEALRVRRITKIRSAQEDPEDDGPVQLVTSLLDAEAFGATDLLELYRQRWDIEEVFQQITEVFALSHLIGCAPQAILLQFSLCLLLYNLMQVIKAYVAGDGGVLASVVSMFYLFLDVQQELTAWAYHSSGAWVRLRRDAGPMRERLRQLLRGVWDPIAYTKASDKKPRRPRPKQRLHGGHTSVQRLLEGRVPALPK